MEIKTKYVEKINEEKQGIELYFEGVPTKEEREQLKANGYKWHNVKKCWYIKQNKIQQPIELGIKEIENSYSGYGWKGVNSDRHLSITEIAKIIKKELKRVFPTATFSVTTEGNCYYNGLNISLMKDSQNPLNDYETAVKEASKSTSTRIIEDYDKWVGLSDSDIWESEQRKKELKNRLEHKNITINQYHIDNDFELSDYGKKIFKFVKELCNSFNYDDSDSMTDYFDCGFYLELKIGKYDKSFELIEA